MIDPDILASKKNIRSLIEENMPEMDAFFNEQAIKTSPTILKTLKKFISINKDSFFSANLNISLAIDTNTLFSCVYRKLINNRESILINISKNPFVTIHYSSYVKNEMIRKIHEGKLNSKKKKVEIQDAIEYTETLLANFNLVKDEEIIKHPDADKILGERDPKDIPIVNLTYSKNNHGLLTSDKDFEDFGEIEKWQIPELGNSTCLMNKGAMTFFISEITVNVVSEFLKLLLAFIRHIFDFIIRFFKALILAVTSIPKEIYLILGSIALIGIIAYFWEDGAEKLDKLMDDMEKFIHSTKEKAIGMISKIGDLLEKIENDETFKQIAKGAGFMLLTNLELMEETERLEKIAINYTTP